MRISKRPEIIRAIETLEAEYGSLSLVPDKKLEPLIQILNPNLETEKNSSNGVNWYDVNSALINTSEEEWRPVVGYEKYYLISNKGRVKSLARYISAKGGAMALRKSKMMSQRKPSQGLYFVVTLADGNHVKTTYRVDMLLLEAFTGVDYRQIKRVRHLDGNNLSNSLENLSLILR